MGQYTAIGAWRMAVEGISEGAKLLQARDSASDAVGFAVTDTVRSRMNQHFYRGSHISLIPKYSIGFGLISLIVAAIALAYKTPGNKRLSYHENGCPNSITDAS